MTVREVDFIVSRIALRFAVTGALIIQKLLYV